MYKVLYNSPIGPLRLVASDAGITTIGFDAHEQNMTTTRHPILIQCLDELKSYFEGKRHTFEVPLDIQGTIFQMAAWAALRNVPHGHSISYQVQSERIGRPRAYRAVANANAANPIPIIIPCHRIVRASGELGGYAGGVEKKAWLIAHEYQA